MGCIQYVYPSPINYRAFMGCNQYVYPSPIKYSAAYMNSML